MQIWQLFIVFETDLQALYLSRTYCHKTGTRPHSCNTPREPTKFTKSEQREREIHIAKSNPDYKAEGLPMYSLALLGNTLPNMYVLSSLEIQGASQNLFFARLLLWRQYIILLEPD